MQWYDNRRNLLVLAAFLREQGSDVDPVRFLAEPWMWELEWQALQGVAEGMQADLIQQGESLRQRSERSA